MAKNKNLIDASKAKKDEFYTKLTDIEKELKHYKKHFKNKIVFCNCDDPEYSNFWRYFELNFDHLGLKKLISTHYEENKPSYKLELEKDPDGNLEKIKTKLKENGDFRSPECVEILKGANIIVTNPPFSLFREYLAQLIDSKKKFIIIGSQNAVTYKEVFSLIKDNKVWLGYHAGAQEFAVPDDYEQDNIYTGTDGKKYAKFGNITWYTNLDIEKRFEEIILYKKYNPELYPKYDEYDAINVDWVTMIPEDYYGMMGVPITFLSKYSPTQFEILGIDRYIEDNPRFGNRFKINGKEKFARIIIKRVTEG